MQSIENLMIELDGADPETVNRIAWEKGSLPVRLAMLGLASIRKGDRPLWWGYPPGVFISYKWDGAPIHDLVVDLAKHVRELGYRAFLDVENLDENADAYFQIPQFITSIQDCTFYILLLTELSADRPGLDAALAQLHAIYGEQIVWHLYKGYCTNVHKALDPTTVIDIPALVVNAGEVVAVIGPVDSGRDALFQLLTGAIRPTTGTVRLAGLDPYAERAAFSRQVGVLFAEDNLYPRLSVLGNLQFFCRLYRLPKTRAAEVLERLALTDHAQMNAEQLPPGLSRRLALGRALLANPRVLLLAQPFAGCEQASVKLIGQVVRQHAAGGAAALVIAQDATDLELLCDQVHRLSQGQIVRSYDPRQESQRDQPFMVPARSEDGITLVDPAEILYVYAQDDRAYLQTAGGSLPTQFTLAELEKRLSRSGFFRAHRAYLVNLQQVKEVIPYTRDSFTLRLKDAAGTEIPLSKSAERELRDLLGY